MRRLGLRILVVLGATGLALGALLSTLEVGLFDAAAFGRRSADALGDPRVAAFAADRVTAAVLEGSPDLTAVRPLILATSQALVGSEPFRALFRAAAESSHRALFAQGTQNVALSLPDAGILLRSAFEQASPRIAERIPARLETAVAAVEDARLLAVLERSWALRGELRALTRALLLVSPLLILLGLWGTADLRGGFVAAGVSLLVAGGALAAIGPAGRALAPLWIDEALALEAARGAWDALLGPLTRWSLCLAGLGALFTAAGTSLIESASADPLLWLRAAAARAATPPASGRGRALWGLGLLLAGLLAVRFPLRALGALVVVAGALLGLTGARELFRLALETVEASPAAARGPALGRALLRGLLGLALVSGLAATWWTWGRSDAGPAPSAITRCNGHADLCPRRLDTVVLPGAHNAMSNAAIPDWMFPHHQAGIPDQLRDGVRALLIDVYYGFPGAARIKTDLSGRRPTTEAMHEILGEEGVEAALRIRERLVGVDDGRRGLYLCHGFCELGATELEATLRDIRSFLVERPGEVVLIVVEDYVAPQDLAAAFESSGLAERVYSGPSGPPWPTLGELVAARANVVAFLESGEPGVAWLRPAFELIQETPYTFHDPSEFSCRPNRGPADARLFQINHWIETTPAPRPSNAEIVNARDVLLARARRCQQERGMLPNVIAVDFYRSGDLFGVAGALNGLEAGSR